MFIEVSTVHERLDNHSHLEDRIHEDPADTVASTQLEMAYRQEGRTEELLQLLLTRAENVADPVEQIGLLREASEICVSTGELHSALMILLTAFDLDRGNHDVANELDRLAYNTGEWDEVLDAYLIAAASMEDSQGAGDLWLRIACAHATVTGDSEALSAALEHVHSVHADWAQGYLDLVERQARSREVFIALAELCGRIGEVERGARCMTRAIAMTDDRIGKAALHEKIARMRLAANDRMAANFHFREALRLDPSREDCRLELVELVKEDGDVRGAAEMLRKQALAGNGARSEAAFEAAALYADLDENTRCFDLLNVTLTEDPNHVGAALPLAERYYNDKRWSELEPLIDLLISHAHELPASAPEPNELRMRGGECAEALSNPAKAQGYYETILRVSPEHKRALTALERVSRKLGHLDKAMQANETLLALDDGESDTVRARLFSRMALIAREQGKADEALRFAQRAITLDRSDIVSAGLMAEIQDELGDYRGALESWKGILGMVDAERAIEIHCSMAHIRCRKLDDPMGAIREYERALGVDPTNRRVLHSLLELYTAAELWAEALKVIDKIAEKEKDPFRRGKYYDNAGAIAWRELNDKIALEYFNKALDCFFVEADEVPEKMRTGCMRPFHRLVEYLHALGDYKELERNYRRMIKRLDADDPEVVRMWQDLGQLYKVELDRPEEAIASYEVLLTIDENTGHKRTLMDLLESAGTDKVGKAIEHRREMQAKDPFEPENYAALTKLHMKQEEPDRAWCALRGLVYLGHATEAEQSFFYRHQPAELRWPRVPMSMDMWQRIKHPDEDPFVNRILALIADVMAGDCAADEKTILARDGFSPLHNELRGIVQGVAYAMGMPPVRVTVDLELGADLLFVPTHSGPIFVVGRGLWQAPTLRARVHAAARILSNARPEAQLRQLTASPEHLEAVFMAALTFVRPDIGVAPNLHQQVQEVHRILRKGIPPARQVQLAHAVQALIASGRRHDMHKWWRAVSSTGQRAALILSGDLQVAAHLAQQDGKDARDIIADLLIFSTSDLQCDIRRDLDIAIVASADPITSVR